ncbi:MAG: NUDIX domain-containing protein [Legionella sp.]
MFCFQRERTTSLPNKKIKKPIPIQSQQFLVLSNEKGHISLEKRPPVGLCGGLWCLPSLDEGDCPLNFIKLNYDLFGTLPQHLLAFKHPFSHFHLEVRPHPQSRWLDGGEQPQWLPAISSN